MKPLRQIAAVICLISTVASSLPLTTFAQEATPGTDDVQSRLGGVRVPFVTNEGQIDPRVAYYAPTFAGTLFVTQRGELVYSLPGATAGTTRSGRRDSSRESLSRHQSKSPQELGAETCRRKSRLKPDGRADRRTAPHDRRAPRPICQGQSHRPDNATSLEIRRWLASTRGVSP